MKNFVKKLIDLIKNNINTATSHKNKPDLKTAFESMNAELEEAEKQYGEKFFPED